MTEVEEICDKVAILYDEKILEQGEPMQIKKKYNSDKMDKVFEKIFSNRKRKTYQESANKKTKVVSVENKKSPWDVLEEKIESNKQSGKYRDDF
jgi:ABC-type multidrug transport system ATPase subunit